MSGSDLRAGGFIGHQLVKRLKREGCWVRGTDLKFPRFGETEADDFVIGDLRNQNFVKHVIDRRFRRSLDSLHLFNEDDLFSSHASADPLTF